MIAKLKYYRHATSLITINNIRLFVDPMYQKKGKWLPILSVPNFKWNPLIVFPEPFPIIGNDDILLITHHHFDHLDRAAVNILPKDITVVTPQNGLNRLKRLGFNNIKAMKSGHTLSISNVEITALPVKHTERFQKLLYKPGIGYLISFGGKSIYISGDTLLFDELVRCLELKNIDLAVLNGGGARIPLLGRHTFSHMEIFDFVNIIKPVKTIVVHLDTLNHCKEKSNQLNDMINLRLNKDIIHVANPGCEYEF